MCVCTYATIANCRKRGYSKKTFIHLLHLVKVKNEKGRFMLSPYLNRKCKRKECSTCYDNYFISLLDTHIPLDSWKYQRIHDISINNYVITSIWVPDFLYTSSYIVVLSCSHSLYS